MYGNINQSSICKKCSLRKFTERTNERTLKSSKHDQRTIERTNNRTKLCTKTQFWLEHSSKT